MNPSTSTPNEPGGTAMDEIGEPARGAASIRLSRRRLLAATSASAMTLAPGVAVVARFGGQAALAQGNDHGSMPGMTPAATQTPAMAGMGTDATPGANGGGMSGGHDMSAVDVSHAPSAGPNAKGNQPLTAQVVDGVKEFRLTASVIKWNILPDVVVGAYAYNAQVPGPLIRVTEGDRVRIFVTNELPEPTSVHWHGLIIPNNMDGVADLTQAPIQPGQTFTYEYTVPNTPGTYFYHTHEAADRQQPLGLYGAFIIDPKQPPAAAYSQEYIVELGEWRVTDGKTYPAMDFDGMLPNYFTINGKSYPSTDMVTAKVGDKILFRFIGTGQFIHPMHIHGGPFQIVATDGNPVPPDAQLTKDTVLVGPGERYDVMWPAREPGKWLLHCHINHHITNNGAEVDGGGGLTMVIDVSA